MMPRRHMFRIMRPGEDLPSYSAQSQAESDSISHSDLGPVPFRTSALRHLWKTVTGASWVLTMIGVVMIIIFPVYRMF
jgi:hypothetical protein